MDSRIEAQNLKKKHEETQGMLRGVTESLLKATEKLQTERKARKSLEQKFQEANFTLNLSSNTGSSPRDGGNTAASGATGASIDFAGLRSEIAPSAGGEGSNNNNTSGGGGMEIDTAMDEDDGTETNKMESLKDFLANTPKANIDWGANATTTPASAGTSTTAGGTSTMSMSAPRSRDRAGVRLCRLLIRTGKLTADDATEVQGMAGKYNLGGFIQTGKPGVIVVEGLEFNCDIFMDNMERQKQAYVNVGKVSERSGRCFPMELTLLNGENASGDFAKACESVGLKEKLDAALNS